MYEEFFVTCPVTVALRAAIEQAILAALKLLENDRKNKENH